MHELHHIVLGGKVFSLNSEATGFFLMNVIKASGQCRPFLNQNIRVAKTCSYCVPGDIYHMVEFWILLSEWLTDWTSFRGSSVILWWITRLLLQMGRGWIWPVNILKKNRLLLLLYFLTWADFESWCVYFLRVDVYTLSLLENDHDVSAYSK